MATNDLATHAAQILASLGIGQLLFGKSRELNRIDLKRQEMLVTAQTEVDIEDIRARRASVLREKGGNRLVFKPRDADSIPQSLEEIALEMSAAEAVRKEFNVTGAVLDAFEELRSDESAQPPETVPDTDWLYRWRDAAGEVSSDELQVLWGRLLAGEIKAPGSYSLRTLEFVRNLGRADAALIQGIAPYVVARRLIRPPYYAEPWFGESNPFENLIQLEQLGIISGVGTTGFQVEFELQIRDGKAGTIIPGFGRGILATYIDASKKISLSCDLVTNVGMEVFGLCKAETDIGFLQKIKKMILSQGFNAKCVSFRIENGIARNIVDID